ncbi:MAG: class I SAM-dependent methyltransferase [Alphaproteobacteria bacterium]|jgi:SAM-dependent methyltransferase|nr:class I SAM-dependent methyltransferase [Alphaproteobacteria bacterium]
MQDDRGKGFSADFGRTAEDYAAHRAGFPGSFYARLALHGIGLPEQSVLDLGTGTGVVARALAGHGCHVVGLDIAAAPIAAARAESTGLAEAAFDVVIAGQCWHWFERRKVADECRRLLRPGGRLVIAHYDWIALPGNVVEATEALIVRYNPAWTFSGGDGFYPRWLRGLARGGYTGLETFSDDVDQPYSHEAWRGRVRASAGIGASLSLEQVARFDAEHAAMLRQRFPEDPLSALHRVFAVIARR